MSPEKEMMRLREMVRPSQTAVLTMETQQCVLGEDVVFPALRDEVLAAGALERAGAVCNAASLAVGCVTCCSTA